MDIDKYKSGVTVLLPISEKEELLALADKRQVSLSWITRKAIREGLKALRMTKSEEAA